MTYELCVQARIQNFIEEGAKESKQQVTRGADAP